MSQSHGRLMIDLLGTDISAEEYRLLRDPQVGGVILFARNITDRQQICDLVAQIRQTAPHLLLAVDQEGGRVQRFTHGFTRLPPMQMLGDAVLKDTSQGLALSHETGWLMASEVLSCGLDISFAPVLDVDRELSSIIGNRSFSDCPDIVVAAAQAFIGGMREAGMAATGKHYPGHGGVVADSHLQAPVDERSMAMLVERDLVPFSRLSEQLSGVMPAHMTFPNIDPYSVGFSRFWLRDMLRDKLGFKGVIFSDDLSMKGADIAGSYRDKAGLALDAGCDMILVCNSRAGALEVLDYMHSEGLAGSEKIASMMAYQGSHAEVQSWAELTASRRWLAIVDRLSRSLGGQIT